MHASLVIDSSADEIVVMFGCSKSIAHFNLLFDRFDTLVLALYTNKFIIVESYKQFMMWCEKILTSEDGMEDKGGWQVIDAVFLVQKVFTLNILKRVQSIEETSDPNSNFFKFVDGPLFSQALAEGRF